MKCFKFITTSVLDFKIIQSDDKTLYNTFYLHWKAETIINESNSDNVFESIYSIIISNIQKSLGQGSGCITDSVIDHNINISKYNPMAGSTYIKLPEELYHPKSRLINIKYIGDNECFIWRLVKYLHPADHHPARITKADKDFSKRLDSKDIKFPVKTKEIHKI